MKLLTITCFFMLLASLAVAQHETGNIEGMVQDNDGKPIPGVRITASSPSLIGGSRTAFTNTSGFYRFPVLAPGIYEVNAELSGFQTITRKDIPLSIGTTLTVDFTLQILQVSETIEVSGGIALIDTTTTAVSSTVPAEIVSNLPRRAGIESLVALTPGVSDDLVAFGAPSWETSFWVDGVNMSNPSQSDPKRLLLNYDQNWIDQVQVTGIGAPAEYGGFTGVVANFVTRSGGNHFHGLFETFFQNEKMISTNYPDPPPKIPFKTYDISTQLGGPILRDKFWFFFGYQYPHTQNFPLDHSSLETLVAAKMLSKLTYKWNEDNTLQGFVQMNQGSDENHIFVHPEIGTLHKDSQWSWNSTWISILNSQRTLEARFGGFYDHGRDIENHPELAGHCDFPSGICSVNNEFTGNGTVHRLSSTISLSQHAENFLKGGHDFRFGVEIERTNSDGGWEYNGGMFYYDYNGGPAQRIVSDGFRIPINTHALAAYAQDEWNFSDHLSASIGARWDHNRLSTDVGTWHSNDQVAPRLGLVWKIDRNNQTVVKMHYGHYFEALQSLFDGGVSNAFVKGFILQQYDNGQWIDVSWDHSEPARIPHDIKQPFMRQFDIGVDRVLPGGVPVGVHYIYRNWVNMIAQMDLNDPSSYVIPWIFLNPITGKPVTVYLSNQNNGSVLGNPPGVFNRYNGVELYASKQFRHQWSLMGSFVYSDLVGKEPLQHPFIQEFTTGNPVYDRPVSWKISGTYPFPWGFNAGWYYRHESGGRWTAIIPSPDYQWGFYGESPGSRKLPSKDLVDLRFEKAFPIYAGQLRFTADVLNILNSGTVTRFDDEFYGKTFGKPLDYVEPRQLRLGIRYTF